MIEDSGSVRFNELDRILLNILANLSTHFGVTRTALAFFFSTASQGIGAASLRACSLGRQAVLVAMLVELQIGRI